MKSSVSGEKKERTSLGCNATNGGELEGDFGRGGRRETDKDGLQTGMTQVMAKKDKKEL
jgi:hypothetical protein